MNVLMMVSWYSTKAETINGGIFHYEQARELQKHCNVAIYYPYDRTISTTFASGIEWGIQTYRSKYRLEDKVRNRVYMFQAMKKIVKQFSPDIIHAHVATEAGRFAIVLGKLFHIPVIITEHSSVENSGVKTFPHRQYADFAYKHSQYNICVSDDLTRKLSEIFPRYSFHTIYNGIDIPALGERTAIKNRVENVVNIGVIAGLYDRYIKGIDHIFAGIKQLQKEGYAVYLHIVGDGEYRDFFEQMAKDMNIDKNCYFYGLCSKEKVFSILAEMDYTVSASVSESFGCAIAESAIMGVPIVATRSGGPESIVTEENGILIEVRDENALIEGMRYMCEHYKTYNRVAIRENAREKFGLTGITRQYMKVYSDVVQEKGERNDC